MYKMSFDLRNKENAAYMTDEPGATIRIDDYETICEIKLGYENFEELESQYRENIGEPSYRKLEERLKEQDLEIFKLREAFNEALKLMEENKRLNKLLEERELYEDIRREKLVF